MLFLFRKDTSSINMHLRLAQSLNSEYPWLYLPVSVHPNLVHGTRIIENAILLAGRLSEEAQGARSKKIWNNSEKTTQERHRENIRRKICLITHLSPQIHLFRVYEKTQSKTNSVIC